MKVHIFNHQDKGDRFAAALSAVGHQVVKNPYHSDVLLTDLERFGREQFLGAVYRDLGRLTVLYPHGGHASCSWNFPGCKHFPFVHSVLVPADGWTTIMRSYGCTYRTFVTGWPFSDVREFGRTSGRSIVFAPKHPNANGYLSDIDKALNRQTFERLLPLAKGVHKLTVRYTHTLDANGLYKDDNVTYTRGLTSVADSAKFIENYDLIVGTQTFAFIAVALGKPTLMFGEFVAPHYGGSHERLTYVSDWPKYKDLLRFPLDILTEDDTHFLIERATYSDYEIEDWKSRMIGGSFNNEAFLKHMESVINAKTEKEPVESPRDRLRANLKRQEEGPRKGEQEPEHERISPLQEGLRPSTQP